MLHIHSFAYFFMQIFFNMGLPPVSCVCYTVHMAILHSTVLYIRKSSSQYMPLDGATSSWCFKLSFHFPSLLSPFLFFPSPLSFILLLEIDVTLLKSMGSGKRNKEKSMGPGCSKIWTFQILTWLIRPQNHGVLVLSSIYL